MINELWISASNKYVCSLYSRCIILFLVLVLIMIWYVKGRMVWEWSRYIFYFGDLYDDVHI